MCVFAGGVFFFLDGVCHGFANNKIQFVAQSRNNLFSDTLKEKVIGEKHLAMAYTKWLAAAGLAAATASAEAFSAPVLGGVRPAVGQRAVSRNAPAIPVRGLPSRLRMAATMPKSGGRFPDSAPTTKRLTPSNAGTRAMAEIMNRAMRRVSTPSCLGFRVQGLGF